MVHGAFTSDASVAFVFNSTCTGVDGAYGFWRIVSWLVIVHGAIVRSRFVAHHERDLVGAAKART